MSNPFTPLPDSLQPGRRGGADRRGPPRACAGEVVAPTLPGHDAEADRMPAVTPPVLATVMIVLGTTAPARAPAPPAPASPPSASDAPEPPTLQAAAAQAGAA